MIFVSNAKEGLTLFEPPNHPPHSRPIIWSFVPFPKLTELFIRLCGYTQGTMSMESKLPFIFSTC